MSYGDVRDQEQFEKLDARISEFISRVYATPQIKFRRTVILFPGGMGSRLIRAILPYNLGAFTSYYTGWIDFVFLSTPASDLQMQGDIDNQNRIVIPDDVIDMPGILQPYHGFTRWCEANRIDWFIFGWDWRRNLEPTIDFFLDRFLDWFRRRVMEQCDYDPLQNFTLIGHSFGGMLVKLILNRQKHPFVQQMTQAITVASPFYGHGGHIHRYFRGQEELNFKGISAITKAISSMRGPYTLMFLDHDTFLDNQAKFASDLEYPLTQYPSMDNANALETADPYNPQTKGSKVRYPANYLFDMNALAAAKHTYQNVALTLDPSATKNFFNIRGVQQSGDLDIDATIVGQKWKRIRLDFDVESDETPIIDTHGPGDGVIPAWSARLLCTPAGNVRTLKGNVDHAMIMSDPMTHRELANIMGISKPIAVPKPIVRAASARELADFLSGLEPVFRKSIASERERRIAISKYLAKYSHQKLERLMARMCLDVVKSPDPQRRKPSTVRHARRSRK